MSPLFTLMMGANSAKFSRTLTSYCLKDNERLVIGRRPGPKRPEPVEQCSACLIRCVPGKQTRPLLQPVAPQWFARTILRVRDAIRIQYELVGKSEGDDTLAVIRPRNHADRQVLWIVATGSMVILEPTPLSVGGTIPEGWRMACVRDYQLAVGAVVAQYDQGGVIESRDAAVE